MCITPSPTQPCFAFLMLPKTSLTTTWWVCETCSSRSRRPRRGEKILFSICKCSHMQQSFQIRVLRWSAIRRSTTMPDYYTSQQLAQTLRIAGRNCFGQLSHSPAHCCFSSCSECLGKDCSWEWPAQLSCCSCKNLWTR